MRLTPALLWTAMLFLLPVSASASDMKSEIDHLIDYVAKTECLFERNGRSYAGKEAVEHINKKYRYFADEIDTTEKFIELSATKSTMSGKFYMIKCAGQSDIKSQQWLLTELKKYRGQSKK